MSTKIGRLKIIQEIIIKNKISRQEDLLLLLINRGFDLTQATLSRDLHELKVGKIHDVHFGSIYFVPTEESEQALRGALSVEFSNNLAVLKTEAGFANSVAVRIDNAAIGEVIGTIAGNDTILIIFKDNIPKKNYLSILVKHFPDIEQLIIK
ncbi:MAG: ArgR family transcriptional regulator [Bacteroidales bacterium]|jgi:transcriptional regulator of arginine metabolism|nr:ArgR family transcriptional regulator [Bacteroidales bacterium]